MTTEIKRVGILGSSMDPITMGHLVTAQEILTRKKLDLITFLPTSQKREDKQPKISDEHRLKMLQLAIKDNNRFNYSTYEMEKNAWDCYTYYTMDYFKKVYPNAEVYFLMGADLLADLPSWRLGEELVAENKFIVIQRKIKGREISMHEIINEDRTLRKYEDHFELIYKGVANETSSSYIREVFEDGGDPRYYMPESVYEYIIEHNLYNSGHLKNK